MTSECCLVGKQLISLGRKTTPAPNNEPVIPYNKVKYFIKGYGKPAECSISREINSLKDVPDYIYGRFYVLREIDDKIEGKKIYCESEKASIKKIYYTSRHRGQRGIFSGKCCFSMIAEPYRKSKKFELIPQKFTVKDAKELKRKK